MRIDTNIHINHSNYTINSNDLLSSLPTEMIDLIFSFLDITPLSLSKATNAQIRDVGTTLSHLSRASRLMNDIVRVRLNRMQKTYTDNQLKKEKTITAIHLEASSIKGDIFYAIAKNDTLSVLALIQGGVNLRQTNRNGISPLRMAEYLKRDQILNLFQQYTR